MILDHLENAHLYRALSARFAWGFDFLLRREFQSLPEGRHQIHDNVIAIVQTYPTKPQSEGRWEAHRQYADIQYIVSGRERMGIAALREMEMTGAYDSDRDLAFFTGDGQFFRVTAGQFAVFFPTDVHMPSLRAFDAAETVTKVVLKVRL